MKIALGTAQFGSAYGISNKTGKPPLAEVQKLLDLAKKSGVSYLDTAPSYGNSQQIIGQTRPDDWQLITKVSTCGLSPNQSLTKSLDKQLKATLLSLNVERLHTVLLHNVFDRDDKNNAELFQIFQNWKSLGHIEKFGFSVYSSHEIEDIYSAGVPDVLQVPLNVADRRLIEDGSLIAAKSKGTQIHARSVFLQGLLLMKLNEIPLPFMRKTNFFQKWDRWCASERLSKVEASIGFLSNVPEVDVVVIGAQKREELRHCMKALAESQTRVFPEELRVSDADVLDPRRWSFLNR